MNAAEAVAQYRKAASTLRRLRCWTGSPPRTKAAARRHKERIGAALANLRLMGLAEVEDRLREERRLLDSAYGTDEWEPDEAARKRSRAKRHQYRVRQLIKGVR